MFQFMNKDKATENNELTIRLRKAPNTGFVNEKRKVEWIDVKQGTLETAETLRMPKPEKTVHKGMHAFVAAGCRYKNITDLTCKERGGEYGRYRDSHGRNVLHIRERFPCFDSGDYLHENRYYHWVYLAVENRLYCVYYEDEGRQITVTEDVDTIDARVWRHMNELGIVENTEIAELEI